MGLPRNLLVENIIDMMDADKKKVENQYKEQIAEEEKKLEAIKKKKLEEEERKLSKILRTIKSL